MRRSTGLVVLLALLSAAPAAAQQQSQEKLAQPVKTMTDGVAAGQISADAAGTGGSFWGGFAGGLFLGLIGTGIAYAAQGPADAPALQLAEAQKHGSEYLLGFQQGFAEKSKRKKRSSALLGGLVGTGTLVLLVVSASGN